MPSPHNHERLRLALPKGRMAEGVRDLLADAGVRLRLGDREYRPQISLPGFEVKVLKPQSIVKMLQVGSRDLGFTGADWVAEFGADLVELLDTGLDPVRLVAAAPADGLVDGQLPNRPLIVASELERITDDWIARCGLEATFLRSFGATEVYPPEDADCIVDVVATGATLRANGLEVIDELMTSSSRLYARPAVLEDAAARNRIDDFVTLLRSVLEARRRVMVEVNVSAEARERLVAVLPCMREPTIAPLLGDHGYAVKVAVLREQLPGLIPRIKELGGTDIVVSAPSQIVP
ncbi:MAG: ATP phosphoribosyltransferase [bacterium]|nr:ATP phosphoribosyltransferase [bacterium]